eukprot:SAG11_NODE_1127_length_5764_cov_33.810944_3_plen_95_part_00
MRTSVRSPHVVREGVNLTLVGIEVEDGRRWTVEPDFDSCRSRRSRSENLPLILRVMYLPAGRLVLEILIPGTRGTGWCRSTLHLQLAGRANAQK